MSTASITLRTGLPGSGKSLRTIERILEELEAGTTVYVCNIADLNVKGVIEFPNPTKWPELPANSILFVDECQRFFPSRRAGELPAHIRAMETIRHMGVRLELITQRPTYIDSHIRGLCGVHEHLLRKNGKDASELFRWDEVEDEPKSTTARAKADIVKYHFKPSLFQYYKSAEIHTMKRRINWRTKKGIAVLCLAALLCAFVAYKLYTSVFGAFTGTGAEVEPADSLAAQPTSAAAPHATDAKSDEDPVLKFVPRLAGMPWTAPAYDGFEVRDYPRAYCIIGGDQRSERITCNCYTQQATVIDMDDTACISIARNGYWDPRRSPIGERQPDQSPASMLDQTAHVASIPEPSPVTGIGTGIDRSLKTPYTPPDFVR